MTRCIISHNDQELILTFTKLSDTLEEKKKKKKTHAALFSYQERHGVPLAAVKLQTFIRSQAAGDRSGCKETAG